VYFPQHLSIGARRLAAAVCEEEVLNPIENMLHFLKLRFRLRTCNEED